MASGQSPEVGGSSFTPVTTTLTGAGVDVALAGLNGDADGIYIVDFYLLAGASGTGVVTARPNGLTTNQTGQGAYSYNATVGAINVLSLIQVSSGSTTGNALVGSIVILAKSGKPRLFLVNVFDANGGLPPASWTHCTWTDTTTNLTGVTLHCATAAGFLTGSTATVRRPG